MEYITCLHGGDFYFFALLAFRNRLLLYCCSWGLERTSSPQAHLNECLGFLMSLPGAQSRNPSIVPHIELEDRSWRPGFSSPGQLHCIMENWGGNRMWLLYCLFNTKRGSHSPATCCEAGWLLNERALTYSRTGDMARDDVASGRWLATSKKFTITKSPCSKPLPCFLSV